MIRAVKLSLKFASATKMANILAVLDRYRATVNAYIRHIWEHGGALNKQTADVVPMGHLTFRMRAHALQQALGIVLATRRSAQSLGRTPTMPMFHGAMILSKQLAVVTAARTKGEFDLWLRFSTLSRGNRIDIPLKATKPYRKWTAHPGASLKGGCAIGGHPGRYYVVVWVLIPEFAPKTTGLDIGIDVGINKLLGTSDGRYYGRDIKHWVGRVRRCKPGSKGKRRARRARDRYINETVNRLPWRQIKLIAVENLKNIKDGKKQGRGTSFRKAVAPWTVSYVMRCIEMKAQEHRVSWVEVNARGTSTTCPVCGHRASSNRSNEKFKCVRCGHAGDADTIGSLNILSRALGSVSSPSLAPSQDGKVQICKV